MRDQCRSMDRGKTESNIARAIRRSRSARASMRWRRRRNIAIAVCLSVALSGGGTLAIGGLTGNDMVEAAVTQAKSLAQLLDQRSPGDRTQAQLTKTKRARALAKQALPHSREHLLASPPLAPKNNLPGLAELLAGPGPVALVDAVRPFPELAISSPPALGMIVGPPPGSGISPPGGGGGGVPLVTPPQPGEIVPTSPLPEPGTWAMMLLGFALLGWRVRRAHDARPKILLA